MYESEDRLEKCEVRKMRNKTMRERDRKELADLAEQIQPQPNEEIARRAIQIAQRWLNKAERQTKQIRQLEERNEHMCETCDLFTAWMKAREDGDW